MAADSGKVPFSVSEYLEHWTRKHVFQWIFKDFGDAYENYAKLDPTTREIYTNVHCSEHLVHRHRVSSWNKIVPKYVAALDEAKSTNYFRKTIRLLNDCLEEAQNYDLMYDMMLLRASNDQ